MKHDNNAKPMRNAIAVILRSSLHSDCFLAVKRPNEGGDLDGFWGLPATRMRAGELPEDAARRVCREKLGCDAVPLRFVGTMYQQRNSYDMFFMDVEMVAIGGVEPNVRLARTDSTVYVDQKWTDDESILLPAARGGSCCSTIFLTEKGLLNRNEWVTSLVGSQTVA
ncbi:MAG TPA: NUDIX hydrolase [Candidatus Saccharimonadales bacterium]|nr:NUDIX hydrolase [Candidatus Saccharimonadales bacterium]